MEEATYADRVLVMDDGRIVMDGTPSQIFSKIEELRHYQMEIPQVIELAHELRKNGVALSESLLEREELVKELCQLL